VDESALLAALKSGLAGAGLDVIEGEWRRDLDKHPLIRFSRKHEQLVITPHIGGVTHESQAMAYARIVDKLVAFFRRQQSSRSRRREEADGLGIQKTSASSRRRLQAIVSPRGD
jgi:phosphoglycerate dehydrogenase-like enzyme